MGNYGIAAGLDSGEIKIYSKSTDIDVKDWTLLYSFPSFLHHSLTVWRMKFRENQGENFELATCGNDNTVRMFKIKVGD